jgi:Fe-S-cluster containining protein
VELNACLISDCCSSFASPATPIAGDDGQGYIADRRIAGGIGPALPAHRTGASVSSPTFDCTACGACCFGGHDRYIAILPMDRDRPIPETATHEIEGRRYMKMACGHCAQLTITPEGQTLCAIYADRPEACRAFRAGSFECLKARQHRGAEALALREFAMAQKETAPPQVEAAPPMMLGQGADQPPADTLNPSP